MLTEKPQPGQVWGLDTADCCDTRVIREVHDIGIEYRTLCGINSSFVTWSEWWEWVNGHRRRTTMCHLLANHYRELEE